MLKGNCTIHIYKDLKYSMWFLVGETFNSSADVEWYIYSTAYATIFLITLHVSIMQQWAHRKTKRLKTATSNIDPVISEEEYIKWIISHQKGRA
jgi:hypothetical protein